MEKTERFLPLRDLFGRKSRSMPRRERADAVVQKALAFLLPQELDAVTDSVLLSALGLSNSTATRLFPEKTSGVSFVTILRRRIVAMGWQVFNEQARKLKVTRLTGLVDGFIKMFSAPHHSVDKQYVVFLAIHARAPSALARGEELLTFNMLLDDLIAQEKRQGAIDPQVRTDVVREIVFGAFFELAYMLYVKDVGIARGTVAYSWSDVRAAMMRIIACFGPAQWGDAAARTVTDGG